jgi:hypothetical protein
MSAPNLFPTLSLNRSFGPCDLCGISRFSGHFSGTCGKTGGGEYDPESGCPGLARFWLGRGVSREPAAESRLWDFSLFRAFLWDVWENRGAGSCPAALSFSTIFAPTQPLAHRSRHSALGSRNSALGTRNSELGTRNWFTNLQLSTYNLQPFSPKLLGLIFLIPLSHTKNCAVITVGILASWL